MKFPGIPYLVAQSCSTLCDSMDWSPSGSSVHEDSPGKNTGVGCPALLQGIFPTQGLNPGLPHCRWIPYHLSHQGSPPGILIHPKSIKANKHYKSCCVELIEKYWDQDASPVGTYANIHWVFTYYLTSIVLSALYILVNLTLTIIL